MRSRQLPWLPRQSGGVTQGAPGRAEGGIPGSAAPGPRRPRRFPPPSAAPGGREGSPGISARGRVAPGTGERWRGDGRGRWAHPKRKAPPLSLLPAALTRGCTREQSPLSYSGLSAVPPVQPLRAAPAAAAARTWQGREKGPERGWACASCARARSAAPGPAPSRPTRRLLIECRVASALPQPGRALTERFFRNAGLGLRRLAGLREKRGCKTSVYLLDTHPRSHSSLNCYIQTLISMVPAHILTHTHTLLSCRACPPKREKNMNLQLIS